ncbi:MAG: amidohydrolase family protein, partial [Sphingomonadales bacterium]|nr:amidohydrolase family protein [Sphingomonadales bacterium]
MASAAQPATRYVRAGRLIDPERGVVETARLLRVENGRVVAITPDTGAPLPAGAQVVDWSGYTVLPGLIDMHVHLADADQTNNPAEPLLHSAMEIAYLGARN